jgi:ribosomal protein L7/L12
MEMWEQLADTVDPDLKGWTFEAMLLGRMDSSIVITNLGSHVNKISIIKAIRVFDRRGLGLKEAKDMYDELVERGKEIVLEVTHNRLSQAAAELRSFGCKGLGL